MIGSFASGILLYGCSLLYGVTGSVDLATIADRLDPENPLALLGAGLVLIGLAFKISSVPFHQWAPDVYEGAPTTISGLRAFRIASTPRQMALSSAIGRRVRLGSRLRRYFRLGRRRHPGKVGQPRAVAVGEGAAPGDQVGQPLQLLPADGRLHVRHPVVETGHNVLFKNH